MAIFSWLKKNKKTDESHSEKGCELLENEITKYAEEKNKQPAEELFKESSEKITENKFTDRLKQRLNKTRQKFTNGIQSLFYGKKTIDKDLLDELEELLITSDVGIEVTKSIIKQLTEKVERNELSNTEVLYANLKEILCNILTPYSKQLDINSNQEKPFVILLIGINGAGKTTTIGKLAKKLQANDKKVMLVAGDTFRAGAIEQLKIWGERNSINVISQQAGSDSSAVMYDAMQSAQSKNIDVVLADTAGRLHTQDNLLSELKKIKRTLQKFSSNAPHEVLLVLDATIGQNALNQAKRFNEEIGVTGLCITKLDGTAKGGIIFAIADQLQIPIRFIGVGESIDDLQPFVAENFVDALLN